MATWTQIITHVRQAPRAHLRDRVRRSVLGQGVAGSFRVRARCCGGAAVCRVCGSLVGKKNTMDLIKLFICQYWLNLLAAGVFAADVVRYVRLAEWEQRLAPFAFAAFVSSAWLPVKRWRIPATN
jgi:hypothetical protein